MRRMIAVLSLMSVLLTACGGAAPAANPAAPAPAQSPTETSAGAPAVSTEAGAAPEAAATVAVAPPAVIGLDNFAQLVQLHDYGSDIRSVVPPSVSDTDLAALPPAFSPDGDQLAVPFLLGENERGLVILDTLTGDLVSTIPLGPRASKIYGPLFTPDGKEVVYSLYPVGQLIVWDIAAQKAGRVLWSKKNSAALDVTISPDGKQIMAIVVGAGSGDTLMVWDAASGDLLWQAPADTQNFHTVKVSADSRRLMVTTTSAQLTVYDTTNGKKISSVHVPGTFGADLAAFSPDGARILTGNSDKGDIVVWDAATGQQTGQVHTPFAEMYDFEFSPDGSMLIASGNPPSSTTFDDHLFINAAVFDASTWKQAGILPFGASRLLRFSSDGKRLLRFWEGAFTLVGLPDEKILAARQTAADFIAALSTGDYAAAAPLFYLNEDVRKSLAGAGLPTDPAAILEAVCTGGAFPCLPGKVIYSESQAADIDNRQAAPMYYFLIQYTGPDGSLYRNADGLSMLGLYLVQDTDGNYKVDLGLDLASVLR